MGSPHLRPSGSRSFAFTTRSIENLHLRTCSSRSSSSPSQGSTVKVVFCLLGPLPLAIIIELRAPLRYLGRSFIGSGGGRKPTTPLENPVIRNQFWHVKGQSRFANKVQGLICHRNWQTSVTIGWSWYNHSMGSTAARSHSNQWSLICWRWTQWPLTRYWISWRTNLVPLKVKIFRIRCVQGGWPKDSFCFTVDNEILVWSYTALAYLWQMEN